MCASGLFWGWLGTAIIFQPTYVRSIHLASVGHEESREASCISHYASKLDGIKEGLGDNVRNRAEGFDFKSVANRNDTEGKIFGAGFGSTGTHSVHAALRLMNVTGQHFGPYAKGITNNVLGRTHRVPKCQEFLRHLFPRAFKYDAQDLFDTPAAELFLDLYWTFPHAKFILSNRPAESWVKSRRHHHSFELAPLEEPCNLHMSDFTDQDHAKMMLYHNDLVRCIVPKEKLFELNFWEDPPAKLQDLGNTLALFVGAEPLDAFPGSKFLRLRANGNSEVSCASELDVAALVLKHQRTFSVQPAAGVSVEGPLIPPQIWFVDKYGKTQILPDSLGFLMHYAAKADCELDFVPEELKEDMSLLPQRISDHRQ